jgi:hypothetical protein
VARLRGTAGAELGQQRLQRTVDGGELHEPRLIVLHTGQRQHTSSIVAPNQARAGWRAGRPFEIVLMRGV